MYGKVAYRGRRDTQKTRARTHSFHASCPPERIKLRTKYACSENAVVQITKKNKINRLRLITKLPYFQTPEVCMYREFQYFMKKPPRRGVNSLSTPISTGHCLLTPPTPSPNSLPNPGIYLCSPVGVEYEDMFENEKSTPHTKKMHVFTRIIYVI